MDKKELLFSLTKKDFRVQTFHSGGPGGQNQNKRDTGVRIIHDASGAVGECREHRSQKQNKKTAFKRLAESVKFKVWSARVIDEILSGKTIEERVDEMMKPENIKVEYRIDNKWVDINGNKKKI